MEEKENVNVKLEDDFKPRKWLLILLIIAMGAIIGVLIYYGVNDLKTYEKKWRSEEKVDSFDKDFNDAKEQIEKTVSEIDVKSFNGNIELYSGTEYGNQVVNLIDNVITSNKKNPDKLITFTFNGQSSTEEETIRGYKKGLEDWTKYEVILDYDENGFVNKVEVRK